MLCMYLVLYTPFTYTIFSYELLRFSKFIVLRVLARFSTNLLRSISELSRFRQLCGNFSHSRPETIQILFSDCLRACYGAFTTSLRVNCDIGNDIVTNSQTTRKRIPLRGLPDLVTSKGESFTISTSSLRVICDVFTS